MTQLKLGTGVPRAALAAAVVLAAAAGAAGAAAGGQGTFSALDAPPRVSVSRNGMRIWIGTESIRHEVRVPGHRAAIGPGEGMVSLGADCRHAGEPPPEWDTRPPYAGLVLDDHPRQRDAYNWLHPMFWILGLLGRDVSSWNVEATIDAGPRIDTTLERRLADYSVVRPGLDVALPARTVLGALAHGNPIRVRAAGREIAIDASFEPEAPVVRAATVMLRYCNWQETGTEVE